MERRINELKTAIENINWNAKKIYIYTRECKKHIVQMKISKNNSWSHRMREKGK